MTPTARLGLKSKQGPASLDAAASWGLGVHAACRQSSERRGCVAGFVETVLGPSAAERQLAFGREQVSQLFFRDYRCITSVRYITYGWRESAPSFDVAVV